MNTCCYTCRYYFDDGRCHRNPPAAPVYDVSYNNVTHYHLTRYHSKGDSRTGLFDFPMVDKWMLCGEWAYRHDDEPTHAMTSDDFYRRCHEEG